MFLSGRIVLCRRKCEHPATGEARQQIFGRFLEVAQTSGHGLELPLQPANGSPTEGDPKLCQHFFGIPLNWAAGRCRVWASFHRLLRVLFSFEGRSPNLIAIAHSRAYGYGHKVIFDREPTFSFLVGPRSSGSVACVYSQRRRAGS